MPINMGETVHVVEMAGYMVVLGLVVWLVWRVFTHTIPKSLEHQQDLFSGQAVHRFQRAARSAAERES